MLLQVLLTAALAGSSWQGPGTGLTSASSVAVAIDDDRTLYAIGAAGSSDTGIFRSTDRGESWEVLEEDPPEERFNGLWADPFVASRLFAATNDTGLPLGEVKLYRSLDRGETWTPVFAVRGTTGGSLEVAFDTSRANTLYVGITDGPFLVRSENGGGSFATLDTPFPLFTTTLIRVASNGVIVVATEEAIFRSLDQGAHWFERPAPPATCKTPTALAIDPTNPDRIFLGTGKLSVPCGEVFRSLDGGQTWDATAPVAGPVADLTIDAFHPSLIYVLSLVTDPAPAARVAVSGDDGQSWKDLGLPVTAGATQLALSEGGARLYAATSAGVYGHGFRRTRTLARP